MAKKTSRIGGGTVEIASRGGRDSEQGGRDSEQEGGGVSTWRKRPGHRGEAVCWGASEGRRSAEVPADRRYVMGTQLEVQSLLTVAHDDDEAVPSCATAWDW